MKTQKFEKLQRRGLSFLLAIVLTILVTAPVAQVRATEGTTDVGVTDSSTLTDYNSVYDKLTLLEEKAKTLANDLNSEADDYTENLTKIINEFYDEQLMPLMDTAQTLFEEDVITSDEMDVLNERAEAIVDYLYDQYGYIDGQIKTQATIENITTFVNGQVYDGEYTINSTINVSSSTTITLNGTITQNGKITIPNGVTLTINGSGTFLRGVSFTDRMFDIAAGGSLIIVGTDTSNKLTIDGGATWTKERIGDESSTRYKATVTKGAPANREAIYATASASVGSSIKLENVVMQNLYTIAPTTSDDTARASAIHVNAVNGTKYVTADLDNVSFENNITFGGNSILLLNGSYATMDNCNIDGNYSANIYAGVIKASGNRFCELEMNNCTATDNYSSGWGGLILWAASYSDAAINRESKAVIDGCTFTKNTARYLGGAISNEANMEIKNSTITENEAIAGGGIATFPFTLTKEGDAGKNACGLILGTGNNISNNIAKGDGDFTPFSVADTSESNPDGDDKVIDTLITYPAGGGGVWCYMNKESWTCSLEIGAGNTISNNEAYNQGGGVYVHQNKGTSTKLQITGATIDSNKAVFGGGVAIGNDTSQNAILEITNGNIINNIATRNGGGAFVNNGECAISGEGSISDNTAINGGGVYINDGTMNITGGYIIGNNATGTTGNTTAFISTDNSGVGGGVYLNQGTFRMTADGNVGLYGNLASFAADDVYANPTGTNLTIPEVAKMNLNNFGTIVGTVSGWYEDYATKDSKYTSGLNGGNFADSSDAIKRYRDASNQEKILNITTSTTNKYVCLTLGYELNRYPLTIIKEVTGDGGELDKTFEFTIALKTEDGVDYVFTDADGNEITGFALKHGEEQIYYIPYGYTYTITEADYSKDGYDTFVDNVETRIHEDQMDVTAEKAVTFVNNYRKVKVLVSKTVSGNLGDNSKGYSFTCVVKDRNGNPYTNNVPETFELSHGDTEEILIPFGYSIEVAETDYSSAGYHTTINGGTEHTLEYKAEQVKDTLSIAYENNKERPVDTGINFNSPIWPITLLGLVLAAGVFGVRAYLTNERKRRYGR